VEKQGLSRNFYRKPNLGLLGHLPPRERWHKSLFVGDSAGRREFGDRSDDDLKFARDAELDFRTPEQFFVPL
jgi:histidinol phosphatase-like enzyme